MENVTTLNSTSKPRLKFIDMARSIAILMMLEGHFTGAALGTQYQNSSYLLYSIWHNIHGLTSPLFFTVTGVIFVYLLSADNSPNYFDNQRIKKGYRRVLQLIFWGYFIQLNLWTIIKAVYYQTAPRFDWLYAFHVLQSIGVGIFFLLILYGIYKWINRGQLYWYYLVGALIMFFFYSLLKNYEDADKLACPDTLNCVRNYYPTWAPRFIQNMFYGQYSDFSFVRFSGYTILGGMIGNIIRINEGNARKWWFGGSFIAVGLLLTLFIQPWFHAIDSLTEWLHITEKGVYELNSTSIIRFGQVVIVLGILMLIDSRFKIKAPLFLKLGQNTLSIYIVHVIILYGGIFGPGLKPLAFHENLSPYSAVAISATAILLFILMVKYIEPLERNYNALINRILFRKK